MVMRIVQRIQEGAEEEIQGTAYPIRGDTNEK
jgi:hypothetical protein